MAINEGLSIKLSGDASEFIAELQRAEAAARGFAGNVSSLTAGNNTAAAATTNLANAAATASRNLAAAGSTLSAVTNATNRLSPVIGGVTRNVAAAGSTISAVTNNTNRLTPAINNATTATQNLNAATASTVPALNRSATAARGNSQAFMALNNIVRDAPFGVIGIGNNITQLADALFGASLAASALTFGLSLLVTGSTILVQKYGSLSNAFDHFFDILTAQERAIRDLTIAREKAMDSADAELISLQSLYRATQNLNIPLAQRNKIVDELQKKYPAYFGNLSNEAILAGKAASAYDKLRASIIAVAQSKAIEEELVAQSKAQRELNKEYAKALASQGKTILAIGDLEQQMRDLDDEIKNSTTAWGKYSAQFKKDRVAEELMAVNAANDILNYSLAKTKGRINENSTEAEILSGEIAKLAEKFPEVTTGFDKVEKSGKSATEILATLSKEMKVINASSSLLGLSLDNLAKQKITALQKAFNDLITSGIDPANPKIKEIAESIRLLSTSILGDKPIDTRRLQEIGRAFKDVKIDPGKLQGLDTAQEQFNSQIDQLAAGIQAKIDSTTIVWGNISGGLNAVVIDMKQQLAALASTAAEGLGNVISGIISGGDNLGKSLYRLVGVMGQFIQDFGKSLVQAATLRLIAEKTLIANPYVALAAGAAAIVIGGALKNAVPSFATGGQVFGEQLAVVGDNPGRSETIIPSEVLDKLSGNSGSMEVYGIIRGEDIYLSNARAGRNKTRING